MGLRSVRETFLTAAVTVGLLLVPVFSAIAADSQELKRAYDGIYSAELDVATTLVVSNLVIEHQDMVLRLDSGRIGFLTPVAIDSTEHVFGGYFEGQGLFRFAPPNRMERDQLLRFFDTDSLCRPFDDAFFFFTDEIYQIILVAGTKASEPFGKREARACRKRREHFQKNVGRSFILEVLVNLVRPSERPLLMLDFKPHKTQRLRYIHNPQRREQTMLYRHHWEPGHEFMELICCYCDKNIDETYANINGESVDGIQVKHYDTDAIIDRSGKFVGRIEMQFDVIEAPTQILKVVIHERLHIDSVMDAGGNSLEYTRFDAKFGLNTYESNQVGLFLEEPLAQGENGKLTFYCQGKIAEREVGEFYVEAGAYWYPHYGYGQRATYDMTFRTHKDFTFAATGTLIEKKKSKDTLITRWQINPPAKNVSFNIGNMKKYEFNENDVCPVDIYFSHDLHRELAAYLVKDLVSVSRHIEKEVAQDVMNSLRLFSHYFGEYPHERMSVGEILFSHAEAFPGFLHLDFYTWIHTDNWGAQQRHRAHEVAHQWWGVGVGYETYHDQWLSEGFAEYSALLYLQAVLGNDRFLDRLKDTRKDIFSAHHHLLGPDEESGPIALGYRTSSTKTRGDYGLIIYRKGAWVLHMLRNMLIDFNTMNEDVFFSMMKEFYETNRGKNVTTRDFQKLAEKYVGFDMTWFFDQWIYGNELPTLEFSYDCTPEADGSYIAKCRIITSGVNDNFTMIIPVEIELDKESRAYIRAYVDKPVYEFTIPGLPGKPKKLRLNPFESVLAKVKQ